MSSFKDRLMRATTGLSKQSREDLFQQKLACAKLVEGNHLPPKIYLDQSIRQELSEPWKEVLIVKLQGKKVIFLTMRDCLKRLWQVQNFICLIQALDSSWLSSMLVSIDQRWMLFDHHLSIKPWTLDFVSSAAKTDTNLVWMFLL